ncbi:MAG: PD40 domain-containing protein [Proteobacteria bacterium]|nr:PD40 domain-containing protein [Pseudomonadota bacterium]
MTSKKFLGAAIVLLPLTAVAAEEEQEWDVNSIPGESRDITIDTRSGSWMSVDVSPDGKSVAFDLLGDIYVLPIEGGDAQSINSGLAWSMQPRFSPDGSEIAFTSDAGGGDNIWIMNSDGSNARQLTEEDFRLLNSPNWSPDGKYVAARKHFTTSRSLGTGEVWIYHRNGGGGVAVVEMPSEAHQKELGEPVFSPDGRYIYYTLDQTPGGTFIYAQDTNGNVFAIRRFDLQTGENELYVNGAGGSVRPTPSPDGKYLAFVRRIRGKSALFLKDLASGAEYPIYETLDQDLQQVWAVHGTYPNMDWMPDSQSIVFWAGGGIKRVDIDSQSVSEIQFHVNDTRAVHDAPRPKIAVAPAVFDTTMVRNAEVSPDGSKVVFESVGRLYVKTLPDGEAKRLTRDPVDHFEYDPAWSRDGRNIAFITWDDQELAHVHRVRSSGGRSTRLTQQPGHYHGPRYSADGRSITFEARSGGYLTSPDWSIQTGVFVVPASGGDSQLVTSDGGNPHFGASNDRLYVMRSGEDGRSLVSMDLNGEKERIHAIGEHLMQYEVAPDDQHFAFRQNYQIYVLPLPPGGKALAISTEVSSMKTTKASGDGGNYPHWVNGGNTLAWTLGATLFSADVEALFALPAKDDEDSGYAPPKDGVSMSMRLAAEVPSSVVALIGARIVTMSEDDGGVIEDGIVVVSGNRISAVGSSADVVVPDGAFRVDVAGKTIIPGLIDAHAHGSSGVGIIPEQNWMSYATLAFGVTTVHDPSNDATEIFAAAEMQRTGAILAPRIFSTGDIVYGARSTYLADINSLDDAREHVRRLKAQGARSIKNYNQPRREQRQQVTTAAREEGMLVVSEGGSLFHMDLSMVADGNSAIEHNLPQSMLYDDVLQFWSQTNVAYTPTLGVTYGGLSGENYWYQETEVWKHPILSHFVPPHILQPRSVRRVLAPEEDYYHTVSAATAKLLADRGVMVSIGAHGQREGLASHWEMWGFVQGGMSPLEALRTATTTPAKALGFDDDIGSIEAGKLADMVILDANVLGDIFQSDKVNMVMLNGRLYDAATMNEKITGNRTTEPFYWQ